jgi:hypothetical protein
MKLKTILFLIILSFFSIFNFHITEFAEYVNQKMFGI